MNNEEMNQNNPEPEMEMGEQQENQFPAQEERSMGAVFGSVVVVIVLLIAAFYFWGNREETPDTTVDGQTDELVDLEPLAEEMQAEALEEQGSSDELDEISKDLEATELEDLTEELDQIEEELGL